MSATAFYNELRSLGGTARRSETISIYKIDKSITSRAPSEVFNDVTETPSSSDLTSWPTKKAPGVMQTVSLLYRDRTTGVLARTYWSTSNPSAKIGRASCRER